MKRAAAVLLAIVAGLVLWRAWPSADAPRGGRDQFDADARGGGPGAAEDTAPPPDPPEAPPPEASSLFLEVVSAQTRDVVPMRVDLFRDARFVRALATPGLARDLPAGTYRAVCRGARFDSEDPPPFAVRGETRLQLAVPTPRRRDVTLLVVDGYGRPVTEGTVEREAAGRETRDTNPAWALGKADAELSTHWRGFDAEGRTVRSAAGIYALGPAWDDTREHARTWVYLFRTADGNVVEARVRGADLADRYVGAVVSPEELLRPVVTPSGEPAARRGPALEGHCFALPWAGPDTWRDLEISVGVEVEGLPSFRYAYPLTDPPARVAMWSEPPPVPR